MPADVAGEESCHQDDREADASNQLKCNEEFNDGGYLI